jgi:hypothetical protein
MASGARLVERFQQLRREKRMASDDLETPRDTEPQSYGGQADWLTGRTGQSVDQTPEKTTRTDEEFYRSRHGWGSTTSEAPAQRSPVDGEVEKDPAPGSSAPGKSIPRNPA